MLFQRPAVVMNLNGQERQQSAVGDGHIGDVDIHVGPFCSGKTAEHHQDVNVPQDPDNEGGDGSERFVGTRPW